MFRLFLVVITLIAHLTVAWPVGISRRQVLASMLVAPSPAFARNLPQTNGMNRQTGTIETLIPILDLQEDLQQFDSTRLDRIPRTAQSFYQLLDAYSDPVSYKQKFVDQNAFLVYYTKGFDGPGRPNIEDDWPVKQTLQYGARNDAWVALDNFWAEWDFQQQKNGNAEEWKEPLRQAVQALDNYVALAPAADVQQAQAIRKSRTPR